MVPSRRCSTGFFKCCILLLIPTLSQATGSENISSSLEKSLDIREPEVKFGTIVHDEINKEGLDQTPPTNRLKRVRLNDVPYFDILNRNREYRRQMVSPSQLPRQPKERWEKLKITAKDNKNLVSHGSGSDSKRRSSVQSIEQLELDPITPSEKSRKRAKQLYYYGPEFLKLLGLSYISDGSINEDIKNPSSLLRGRSIEEIMATQNGDNKLNTTNTSTKGSFLSSVANAAGSQIGAALANNLLGQPANINTPIQNPNLSNQYPSSYLGEYTHISDQDYDYDDATDYAEQENDDNVDSEKSDGEKGKPDKKKNKKTGKRKTKRRPNRRPSYYGQPNYPSYALPYSPYAGVHPSSHISAGLNNPYQPPIIGSVPAIGSGLAQGQVGIGSRPGIAYGGEQGVSSLGGTYHQTYPSTQLSGYGISSHVTPVTSGYGNPGFTSPVTSSFNQPGYLSPATFSTSSYAHSGLPSNYPSSNGYTTGSFAGSYYGSPYGRVLQEFPEARKKGSGSTVGKVVGGALAAGAGLALLGALNNRRPQYGHYPNYPPSYSTPAALGYSPYGHSSYPSYAQPGYPVHAQPGYPSHAQPGYPGFGPSHYPSNFGGYGGGYPLARSQDITLEKTAEEDKGTDAETVDNDENLSDQINEQVLQTEDEVNYDDEEVGEVGNPEATALPIDEQQPIIVPDDNGLVLYPTFIPGPVILPAQPSYLLPDVNKYYDSGVFPDNPYLTQYLPIALNDYPYAFVHHGPGNRQKRSVDENQTEQNEEIPPFLSSASSDSPNSTNTSNAVHNTTSEEEVGNPKYAKTIQKVVPEEQKNVDKLDEYTPPIPPEGRRKRKKPSRGTLLAAGLIGAAAGYALTNTGINSYHNRPPPHYAASYPYTSYNPSIGYPPRPIGTPLYAQPGYSSHAQPGYPARPPVSPYYYPLYRSIPVNKQESDQSTRTKELNETRSPFILISTQLKPANQRPPNQFPYNQQYYYQQYHANNYAQVQNQLQHPNQNRLVYFFQQPFIQNQVLLPQQDKETMSA